MSARTELVIVRHGESWTSHVEARGASEANRGITARGLAQAKLTAEHLTAEAKETGGFDAAYVSPRRRCLETAAPIAEALGIKPVVAQELRSLDHERGRPFDPDSTDIGTIPPLMPRTPVLTGAETWESYLQRAGAFLEGLARRHPARRILVVAHAETQTAAVTRFLRLQPDAGSWWRAHVDHAGICRWFHEFQLLPGADKAGCWVLNAHNDTSHLKGMSPGQAAAPHEVGP